MKRSTTHEDLSEEVREKISSLVRRASLYDYYGQFSPERVIQLNNEFDMLEKRLLQTELLRAEDYCREVKPFFGSQRKYWKLMREVIIGRQINRVKGFSPEDIMNLLNSDGKVLWGRKYGKALLV